MATLTAANSVYMLTIIGLFNVPQQLQGFAADEMFDTEAIENVELLMGVDGVLSAGWIPTMKKQTVTLQADSPSNALFDAWATAEESAREKYIAGGIIRLPALSTSYAMVRGFLSSYRPVPPAKKILQPRQYGITWGSILPAPI
jgi:hypothetical protein